MGVGAAVRASESRTKGKFVARALNLGPTTLREAPPPVQPRFLHPEMGIVILNLAGLLWGSGCEAECSLSHGSDGALQVGEGKEPTADFRPFVRLFMPHDLISPFTPPLR